MNIILHPFVPTVRPSDQIPTWRVLRQLPSGDWRVAHWLCETLFDYHDGLVQLWTWPGDLYVVEQDNAPMVAMLEEMAECTSPVCTRPYWIGPPSTGLTGSTISITADGGRPRNEVKRADHSAIGCVRLSEEWRKQVGLPERELWYQVEGSINRLVQASGLKWCVHWPICQHNHGVGK